MNISLRKKLKNMNPKKFFFKKFVSKKSFTYKSTLLHHLKWNTNVFSSYKAHTQQGIDSNTSHSIFNFYSLKIDQYEGINDAT